MGKTLQAETAERTWPKEGWTRIPFWVYTDPELFEREMDHFFYGPSWNYVALDCEVPEPGSYKRSWIGQRQVIVVRKADGDIAVLENRCAHRGARVCWQNKGRVDSFTCPYHQWNFALDGRLQGIPLKRGALGKGGMPADFAETRSSPRCQSPVASTKPNASGARSCASRWTSWPSPRAPRQVGVVDVRPVPRRRYPWKMRTRTALCARPSGRLR